MRENCRAVCKALGRAILRRPPSPQPIPYHDLRAQSEFATHAGSGFQILDVIHCRIIRTNTRAGPLPESGVRMKSHQQPYRSEVKDFRKRLQPLYMTSHSFEACLSLRKV